MVVLSKNRHTEVSALLKNNYEGVYARLKGVLSPQELRLFARPKSNSTERLWYTTATTLFKPYLSASEAEKDTAAEILNDLKESILPKLLADKELAPIAHDLFIVPSEQEILVCKSPNGAVSITLVQWACRRSSGTTNSDPLSMVVNRPKPDHFPVTVQTRYSDGSGFFKQPVYFQYKDRVKAFKTDSKGLIHLGLLKNGATFSITLFEEVISPARQHTVNPEQTIYEVVFPYYIPLIIKVLDQEGLAASAIGLISTYNGKTQQYTSDSEGIITIPQLELVSTPFVLKEANKQASQQSYQLNRDSKELIFKVNSTFYGQTHLKIVDEIAATIGNYPVSVSIDGQVTTSHISNANGLIELGDIEVGKVLKVTDGQEKNSTKEYTIEKGKNEFVLQVKRPVAKMVQVQLINHKNKPLPNVPMDFTIGGKEHHQLTNEEGYCQLEAVLFTDKEKIPVQVHVKNKKGKKKVYKKRLVYAADQLAYTIKLKRFNWWWLLLLLPLLLFVKCEKDIQVKAINSETNLVVTGTAVVLQHEEDYLYDKGNFFANEEYLHSDTTNAEGVASFKNLGYSIYSFLFKHDAPAIIYTPTDGCYTSAIDTTYHCLKDKSTTILLLQPVLIDLDFKVIDKEDKEPLPDVSVTIKSVFGDKIYQYTAQSDAAGRVVIQGIPKCGILTKVDGLLEGYYPDSIINVPIADLVGNIEKHRQLALSPIKQHLTFFVEDCQTKRRLPGASVTIEIEIAGKKQQQKRRTNVNGVGKGVYKDVHIIADVKLIGSLAPYYKSGTLPSYQVGTFVKLPDSLRTICLEPLPNPVKFKNIDTLTQKPLSGVQNIINIKNGGINTQVEVVSDKNGEFVITLNPGDIISIISKYPPDYRENKSSIQNKDGIQLKEGKEGDRIIPLSPKMVTVLFRTVDGDTLSKMIPDVSMSTTINIDNSPIGGLNLPKRSNSNGLYEIRVPINATISIAASKLGYGANATKISNEKIKLLQTRDQSSRDIPLVKDYTPRESCRIFVSGLLVSDEFNERAFSAVYKEDRFSEYVGEGEYTDNSRAFPKAAKSSFDGIAIDKGTRVIIYNGKNFKGQVLLDQTGPAMINNIRWKDDFGKNQWQTKIFKGALQQNFPPSVRFYSNTDMHDWSEGSIKVICGQ